MAELKKGQTVETNAGATGVIRYIGDIAIAQGQFIGLELPDASGKNDGSINTGQRYFSVKPFHGLFIRPAAVVRIVAQPSPVKAAPKPAATPKPRSAAPRTSLRPTSLTAPPKQTPKPASNRLSVAPSTLQSAAKAPNKRHSVSSTSTSSSPSKPALSRPPARPAPASSTATTTSRAPSQQTQARPAPVSRTSQATQNAQAAELETKNRHLEKQHEEDKARLQVLEKAKDERDRFEGIIQKLQSKCQTFHGEITSLKTELKDSEAERDRLSRHEQESESILELATLDREMAEERFEQAEAELEAMKQKLEEQALELEIFTSERELLTEDMSEEEKQAAGYYRLQNENTRLKEALFRLKELTEETEEDLQARVEELEADVAQTEALREERDNLKAEILSNEDVIEDLRQQIDAANAVEDIVEDLSMQNQQIKDKLAEKDAVIRDLENLKELNDELEQHHIEQESDLRLELEIREAELAETIQRVTEQDTAIVEQEQLIERFRDLIIDLQTKMTDAESSKTMSEEQAKDVSGRFHEVMELNRRLRTANVNSQNKTILSELQVLRADQAEEELKIASHFLPESPALHQHPSVRAYFCAKRIAFKASLSHGLVAKATVPGDFAEDPEVIVQKMNRSHTLHHLNVLRFKADQFWAAVSSANTAQFEGLGRAWDEMVPVEKAVDRTLDALKQDELNYNDLVAQIRGAKNITEGVNTDFKDVLAARPEDEVFARVSCFKSGFEFVRNAFDLAKSNLTAARIEEDDAGELTNLMDRMRPFAAQAERGLLAAEKLINNLETLRADSLYPPLQVDTIDESISSLDKLMTSVEQFATKLTDFLVDLLSKTSDNEPATLPEHAKVVFESLFSIEGLATMVPITEAITSWDEWTSVLGNNIEIDHGPAPWTIKAAEMEASKRQSGEAEKQLQNLMAEHQTTMLQIRERDEIIETKDLENEHLKAKHRDAATKVQDLQRMDAELARTKREYETFRQEVGKEIEELKRAETRRAQSSQADAVASAPVPKNGSEAEGGATGTKYVKVPQESKTIANALASENEWLRRNVAREKLGANTLSLFAGMAKRREDLVKAKDEALRHQTRIERLASEMMNLQPAVPEAPGGGGGDTTVQTRDRFAKPRAKDGMPMLMASGLGPEDVEVDVLEALGGRGELRSYALRFVGV